MVFLILISLFLGAICTKPFSFEFILDSVIGEILNYLDVIFGGFLEYFEEKNYKKNLFSS